MYEAVDNIVYYHNPKDGWREIFLTINPNQKDCTKTASEQAILIAEMLNGM